MSGDSGDVDGRATAEAIGDIGNTRALDGSGSEGVIRRESFGIRVILGDVSKMKRTFVLFAVAFVLEP